MDWFNVIAGVASIVGLVISVYTLYLVGRLPKRLRRVHENQLLLQKIDELLSSIPASKIKLTNSSVNTIEFLIETIRRDYLAWPFWKDAELKRLLNDLRAEANGRADVKTTRGHLEILRGHLLSR